jgi:DNA-binding transcriptional ArsR family regulator
MQNVDLTADELKRYGRHLVLKEVGLVRVRKEGRQRLYSVDAEQLKPVHDWVKTFEKYWDRQLDRIKERAERMAREKQEKEQR